MSRSREHAFGGDGNALCAQRTVEMFAPRAHFWSRLGCSVVLCESLWSLCWAFRNLTQRTQRKATEGLTEAVR
jgi:hypothetical protein